VGALISVDHPWVDSSRAPLYILNFPASTTDEELIACCAAREAWAERAHYPVAWMVDLSAIRTVTPRQRQIFASHLGRLEQHNITYNRGAAVIVPNSILRGVVTAVFWFKPPKFPYRLFAQRQEGVLWADGQLRAVRH
jgi:hypothetical protein